MDKLGVFGKQGAFYRENNRKSLGVMNREFSYSRTFDLPDGFCANHQHYNTGDQYKQGRGDPSYYLEAEGLDTLTTITFNGKVLGRTDNMHRAYRFEVSSLIRTHNNSITIKFHNSLEYIKNKHLLRPLMLEDPEGVTTLPGFYTIRKSHCSFGWDWGPQMPDAGIWRPIRIVRIDGARFQNLRVLQWHSDTSVELTIKPEIEILEQGDYRITGIIQTPENRSIPFACDAGETCILAIENPQIWWPNGMGEQPLYEIRATLYEGDYILGVVEKTIGLRTLTVERKEDAWGESFHFLVNDIPLFARGANYVPEDIYLTRMDKERTYNLLNDCREANFNCIRVWGGGVYPNDYFYDICDRLGLIVWQDLMFACAIYDIQDNEFVDNISAEIRQNLERIRHHACLGLVCGNNEMEWFFVDYDSFPQTKENEYEYIKQYHIVIPEVHRSVCPEIFYWSSSPSSGGYFETPNDPNRGDCHFWEVWHGNREFSEYKRHYFRFMSEFGFESLPTMRTILSFTKPEDRNMFSVVMEEHQKRVGGNSKIVNYLTKYFQYPTDLDALVYVSQLSQAEAIRYGVEHWRRHRGRCMGAIYWQLNDNWPVASWSSIDYYGNWKALHYAVKKAFDNILLSIDGDDRQATVHISNESEDNIEGALTVHLITVEGERLATFTNKVRIPYRSSSVVESFDLNSFPTSAASSNMKRKVLFFAEFLTDDGKSSLEACHTFVPYKHLDIRKPDIEVGLVALGDVSEIRLRSTKPALFVEISEAGSSTPSDPLKSRFLCSDNFFHMIPDKEYRVQIITSIHPIISTTDLAIRTLLDSYTE